MGSLALEILEESSVQLNEVGRTVDDRRVISSLLRRKSTDIWKSWFYCNFLLENRFDYDQMDVFHMIPAKILPYEMPLIGEVEKIFVSFGFLGLGLRMSGWWRQ